MQQGALEKRWLAFPKPLVTRLAKCPKNRNKEPAIKPFYNGIIAE
jgi:hypothetical protein